MATDKKNSSGRVIRKTAKRHDRTPAGKSSSTSKPAEQHVSRRSRSSTDQRKHPSTATVKQPPVMARSYDLDASSAFVPRARANQRPASNLRRRIDVPLGKSGAEIRLPSLPAVRFSWRGLVLVLVGLMMIGLYFLWQSDIFRVNTLVVEGLSRVRSSEVEAVLDIAGRPVLLLRPAKIKEELLSAFPEFSSARIQVVWPDQVKVSVIERQPVLTWMQGGRAQLVDQDGYIFPLRLETSVIITPVVEALGNPPGVALTPAELVELVRDAEQGGETETQPESRPDTSLQSDQSQPAKPFMTSEMVSAILEMGGIAPAGAPLVYDPDHGLGWQDGRGWQVYLGEPADISAKLFVYQALVDKLLGEGVQPELVSVEYVHNPYFIKAEEPEE